MPNIRRTEESIFAEALEKPSPEERVAFLDGVCGQDAVLRDRVGRLLKSHEQAGSFLGKVPAATVDQPSGADRPGAVIGPYKLLQKIGEGGMGTVYMAEQTEPMRRVVALKIIKAGMDSAQVSARFEAERQALALMDHPNIAKVLDAGTTQPIADLRLQNADLKSAISNLQSAISHGRPYFVMELVKGIPITKFCDENQLTPRARLELFIPVCQAVQHAHTKGIIHRDLKPSNVLVALYDDKPVPKVIDFGVAKATGEKLTERTLFTEFGSFIGTLEYMSPEQAKLNALDIDTRSDIYALGVLLYELLTGGTPLEQARLQQAALDELLRIIREEEPPRPSTRLSQSGAALATISARRRTEPARLGQVLRGELDWIVMKALDKDRTRRYETANGLARDLQHYLADEPVEACPPTAGYRLRKFVRKHKKPLAGAAAFAALLLIGRALARGRRCAATRAEARATEAAAQANAVLGFLQDQVLAAARPAGQEGGLARDVTLRHAVDAAEPKIAAAFEGQPLIEASLRNVLGTTYLYLGEAPLAIRQYQRVNEIRQATLGADHLDTLVTMNNLARAYSDAGRVAEALSLYGETLKRKQATLGPDHRETLISMNNLAAAYDQVGKFDQALALHEEILAKRKTTLGADHPDTLVSMSNVAQEYYQAGRFAEAVALDEETLNRRKAALSPDHPETLTSMNNLAAAYLAAGRTAEALPLFEETVKLKKAHLGPDHPGTLQSMNNLAAAYLAAGRQAEALSLFEETVKLKSAKLGPDHPETLMSMQNLAITYHEMGDYARAEPLLREVLALRKQKLGAEHPLTGFTLACLGQNSLRQGHDAEAEPLLRESLAIYQKRAPEDWRRFDTQSMLGESLLGQKKYTAAEPLLLAGYQGLEARAAKIPAYERLRPTEALERLVRLYEALDQPAKAEEWRKKLPVVRGSEK